MLFKNGIHASVESSVLVPFVILESSLESNGKFLPSQWKRVLVKSLSIIPSFQVLRKPSQVKD